MYPDYAGPFAKFNLTWEPIKVKTEAGWTLTMFHITGDTTTGLFEVTKVPLLMEHGMGGNGTEYLSTINPHETPMAFQFARMGFDVYIANNSAVQYSMENDQYTYNDPEYW